MKQVKLGQKYLKNNLAEIFQSINIQFAFVDKEYQQVSQPCRCRDFLGDVLWSHVKQRSVTVWGFTYNYANTPYDLDTLRISAKFPNEINLKNFLANLHHLEEKEKLANTKPLEVLLTKNPLIIVIEADKVWQSSVWKLSLYTFFIKKYSHQNPDNLGQPEANYQATLTPDIEKKLLLNIHNPFVDWAESLGDNHDRRGFISLIKGHTKKEHNVIILGQTT